MTCDRHAFWSVTLENSSLSLVDKYQTNLAQFRAMRSMMLQVFNSRTCQLVLGAGAMQVSGLRSITAKHLALSSQCLSAYIALHPLLKPLLTATLPAPRLGLLLPEFDRLLQVTVL